MGTYKMLSLDRSGSRGVVSAVLVGALAERVSGFLDRVDVLFLPKWNDEGLRKSLRDYFGETRTLAGAAVTRSAADARTRRPSYRGLTKKSRRASRTCPNSI